MKTIKLVLCAWMLMMLATSATQAVTLTKNLLTFATPGVDRYADGSAVANGETYMLVFVPKGTAEWSIDSRGTPVPATVERECVRVAVSGHCPEFHFQYAPKSVEGTFCLVLLDTRDALGRPNLANGVFAVSLAACQTLIPGATGGTLALQPQSVNDASATLVATQGIARTPGVTMNAPVIDALALDGNEAYVSATADEIGDYTILQSDDLRNWEPVRTNVRAFTMRNGVPVPLEDGAAMRFYQIRSNVKEIQ